MPNERLPMTSQQYQLLKEIVLAAWERGADTRTAFLDQACGNDAELYRLAVQMLRADENAGHFLTKPVMDLSEAGLKDIEHAGMIGMRIGHYVIEGVIGHGG